tara:strand:- start:965 stop:1132 length:168 start_codon:yes stop_codon:yes gene_type:complete
MNNDFIYECINCNEAFEAFEPPFDGKDLCDPCRTEYAIKAKMREWHQLQAHLRGE